MSRQETAEERVRRILTKGVKLRELARFIHSDFVLKDPDNPPNYDLSLGDVSRAADGGKEMGAGLTADQIYVFAKKCKDKGTRGFIDFIFKQPKGTLPTRYTDQTPSCSHRSLSEVPPFRGRVTYAKKFYGYEARLAKKAEKKKQLATMREKTAHNARPMKASI